MTPHAFAARPRLRLLYLGFAFPPGIARLHPEVNPAGHALETQMIHELRHHFEIRSTAVLPFEVSVIDGADPHSGLPHDLMLLERPPELFTRWSSLARLKARYRQWHSAGWHPELVLVYNLSPIYNQFLRWLRRQPDCPKLVLLLLDSPNLGQSLPWLKRFRRRFKPMCVPDSEMLPCFDACIGLSQTAARYFHPRNIPFLWMPGGCTPARALNGQTRISINADTEALRLGYFGTLGPHGGIEQFARTLLAHDIPARLDICGFGKGAATFAQLASANSRIKFHGLLTPRACLQFGHTCDVLVNPRPASHGNENNFASKLFDYSLTSRAILSSDLAGAEAVLGPDAFYFDPLDFDRSVALRLDELTRIPRSELNGRGAAIQRRILANFSWVKQAAKMAGFIERVWAGGAADAEISTALAA